MIYKSTLQTVEKGGRLVAVPKGFLLKSLSKRTTRYQYLLRKQRHNDQLDYLYQESPPRTEDWAWFCHTSSIENLERLGLALMLQRYDRELTQSELAKIMHTSRAVISKIEHGKQNITFEYLTRFATALEVPMRLSFLNGFAPFKIDIPCKYCKKPEAGIELLKRFRKSESLEK